MKMALCAGGNRGRQDWRDISVLWRLQPYTEFQAWTQASSDAQVTQLNV